MNKKFDWNSELVFPSVKTFYFFILITIFLCFAIISTIATIIPNYFGLAEAIVYWICVIIFLILFFQNTPKEGVWHG